MLTGLELTWRTVLEQEGLQNALFCPSRLWLHDLAFLGFVCLLSPVGYFVDFRRMRLGFAFLLPPSFPFLL